MVVTTNETKLDEPLFCFVWVFFLRDYLKNLYARTMYVSAYTDASHVAEDDLRGILDEH